MKSCLLYSHLSINRTAMKLGRIPKHKLLVISSLVISSFAMLILTTSVIFHSDISVKFHSVIYHSEKVVDISNYTCPELFPKDVFNIKYFSLTSENIKSNHHYTENEEIRRTLQHGTIPALKYILSIIDHRPLMELPANSTCVVVGSSGVLNEFSLGKVIDKYDYIFRFNNAPVLGYEPVVGSRTSFDLTYLRAIKNVVRTSKDHAYYVIYIAADDHEFTTPLYFLNQTLFRKMGLKLPKKKSHLVNHEDLYDPMREFFLKNSFIFTSPYLIRSLQDFTYRQRTYPSGGMFGLIIASKICPQPPDIAGFNLSNRKFKYHYYGGDVKSMNVNTHNPTKEIQLLKTMLECGMLGKDLTSMS